MLSIDSVSPIKLALRLENTLLKKVRREREISLEIGPMQGGGGRTVRNFLSFAHKAYKYESEIPHESCELITMD
jgi:hypothetical protein